MIPAWKLKLPLWITFSRMLFVIPIVAAMVWHLPWLASFLFIVASATDWFDGYFARRFAAVSTMGQFMDPIADKILVSSVLVELAATGKVDPYLVMILLARDTLVGGIRAVAAADQVIIAAQKTGKLKTAFQMVGIPLILIGSLHPELPNERIGYYLLWVTVFLSAWSGVEYYIAFLKSRKTAI